MNRRLAPTSIMDASGHRAARSTNRGMTLVEVTVVVLVLAISIVAIATSSAMLMRDKEMLKSEARQLAGFLEHTRSLAALNGKKYTVQYDLGDSQQYFVWAPRKPQEGEVYQQEEGEDTRVAVGVHQMPSRVTTSGERLYSVWIDSIRYGDASAARERKVRIDFMPTGGSHWHYVYLMNELGEYYTVEVNPFTGFAEVYPGEVEPQPPERMR